MNKKTVTYRCQQGHVYTCDPSRFDMTTVRYWQPGNPPTLTQTQEPYCDQCYHDWFMKQFGCVEITQETGHE